MKTGRSTLSSLALALSVFVALAGEARAQTSYAIYRFATQAAHDLFVTQQSGCQSATCTLMIENGGTVLSSQAYTSDYDVLRETIIQGAQTGDTFKWTHLTPDGSTTTDMTVNYAEVIDPVTGDLEACWYFSNGYQTCSLNAFGAITAFEGPVFNCPAVGNWTLQFLYNGTVLWENQFSLAHNSSGILGISSPTDNQLIDLDQNNYTATSGIPFTAGTNTGNQINWNVALHYQSSGGYPNPSTDPAPLQFSTTNAQTNNSNSYQSIGGQVKATARTTASDGSTVQDCVTFYIEGSAGGIPDSSITGQLKSLYQSSQSYPTDGTATPNLMTGVAERESSYHPFLTPAEGNSDLFQLYANFDIAAKWPNESPPGALGPGAYIGLMMVPTTDPDACNWQTNAYDAVSLFSGATSPNKMTLAINYENDIINGVKTPKLPGHLGLHSLTGLERENMALVLYSGIGLGSSLATNLTMMYYAPLCSSGVVTSTSKGLQCTGGTWNWVVNDGTSPSLQPGNPSGVEYVNSNVHPLGVRNQLQ